MRLNRVVCVIMSLVMIFLFSSPVLAVTTDQEPRPSVEDILAEYYFADYSTDPNSITTYGVSDTKLLVENKQERTLNALVDAGYEAYSVTKDTFLQTQEMLKTDFDSIGLSEEYSYIIVVEGEPGTQSVGARSTVSNTFNYIYDGAVYQMRYLTVTAADDPAYGKASCVNLLDSKVREFIINCLDTAIYACIDSVSKPLGTVASICGLSLSNIDFEERFTLNFNAGTNWTRIFTQVWDDHTEGWTYGASVEYAMATSYMSGMYYSASENLYVSVPENRKTVSYYSEHFSDGTWRKQMGVYGAINYWTQYDAVGNVKYKYGNKVVVTHYENFR